jgi:tetratricopeptide (TPR) repeat protein
MKRLRLEHYIILGLCGFLLALAVTTDYHRVVDYLFSDEAVYYMMAQSLAFDQDMEYTQQDLQRVYEEGWYAGPQGVYLTKADDGKIYYGKYLAYSLFLAPFIAIFGLKGFLILHVLLLCLMIWIGWVYLRQFNPQNISLLFALTFFLLSASFVYTFWLTPEIFNMFCVTFGLFLWLYRRENRLSGGITYNQILSLHQTRHPRSLNEQQIQTTSLQPVKRLHNFLSTIYIHARTCIQWLITTPNGRLYLAPVPIAIACASKITNILFLAPILADVVLTEGRRLKAKDKEKSSLLPLAGKILMLGLVFGIVAGMFFGFQYIFTGNFNQYAGDRRLFIGAFPFGSPKDVWEQGIRHSNEDYQEQSFFFTPKTLLYNIYYYIFGRFTGMLPYFVCSFLALYYFVRQVFVRPISPFQKMELFRRLGLLLAIVAHIMGYIIMAPINYHGGSGAFGNRFFLNIYPAFLFLITTISLRGREKRVPIPLIVSWIIGSLFLAQTLLNPFQSSYYPAAHAFKFPYRFLPVELTMINAIPTHVNPHLLQVAHEEDPPHRIYFVDENAADLNAREFWVQGERTSESVIMTNEPQSHLVLTVTNGPIANRVDASVAGTTQSIRFTTPKEKKRFVFPLKWSMPYFESSLYPMKIRSHTGFVPKFIPATELTDPRYLGCRVNISLNPLEVGKAYLENDQPQKALAVLEPAVQKHSDDIKDRYYLGIAYLQTGKIEAAIEELERCKTLLPDFQEDLISENFSEINKLEISIPVRGDPSALFRTKGTYRTTSDTLRQPLRQVQDRTQGERGTGSDLASFLYPITRSYEAENLLRKTGNIVEHYDASNGKGVLFNPAKDSPGFVAYGPYTEFPAGEYQARYRMKIRKLRGEHTVTSGEALFFDVYNPQYGVLKKDSVLIQEGEYDYPNEYREYTLNFELASPAKLEFRVETTGQAQVTVDKIDVYPHLPLQIYQGLAQAKSSIGAYEEAYQYLQYVVEVDPWTLELQIDFLQALLNLKQWGNVLQFTKRSGRFSDAHTGIVTYLNPQISNLSFDLPESLARFYNNIYTRFSPEVELSHNFGDKLVLIGSDIKVENLGPGGQFSITYYWKSLTPVHENYAIFVHFKKKGAIIDPETTSRIKRKLRRPITDMFQQDHHPLHGAYPTSKWIANELIREQYDVTVPPEIEPGTYEIWIGVWNPFTKIRLKTDDGKTKVKIGEIHIKRVS